MEEPIDDDGGTELVGALRVCVCVCWGGGWETVRKVGVGVEGVQQFSQSFYVVSRRRYE